jgi:hypothetical protein
MMDNILAKSIPGDYRIESNLKLDSTLMKTLSTIPLVNSLTATLLKKSGKVFLRVWKVDLTLPQEYTIDGWKVRNRSERADGVYYSGGGYVSLGNQGRSEDLPGKS